MIPRRFSLVKFDFEQLPKEYWDKYPFKIEDIFLFLDKISNMPEHCIVMNIDSKEIHIGYHTENFIELTDKEI